jgi:diguanylate cyclase (GGDEF)-like protein
MKKKIKEREILIVDDMSSNITALAEILKFHCKIKVANTGKKALEIAFSDNPPDVILLDVIMPEMDGYEVCKILKGDSRTKDIPIIFITSSNEVEEEIKGLELGAIDYITKPFNSKLVRIRVINHLELKLYRDMLKENSMIDGLTGIYNKAKFNNVLETEWRRSRRLQKELSVIILDIDKFKAYNDSYGHLKGDECIKSIAEVLDNFFKRPGDLTARWGGEEFSCLLPDTDINNAKILAEGLRQEIENLNIEHKTYERGKITISLGVSSIIPQKNDDDYQSIMVEADNALYKAKEMGRNRVEIHETK